MKPIEENTPHRLPKRSGGRRSAAVAEKELAEERVFAEYIEQLYLDSGYAFGPRGWAYFLEGKGTITKQEFSACERVLARMRKEDRHGIDRPRHACDRCDYWSWADAAHLKMTEGTVETTHQRGETGAITPRRQPAFEQGAIRIQRHARANARTQRNQIHALFRRRT